ncbi:hypothetical protein TEA_014158 [Camellia sinensis var. sinensis]|uniref:Plastocyanin-like domain-containing protein n=1 Tax=Camellia sinensis var. sinensis TaxID=542762 RepID=A0A4S4DSG3_CAMSN|nr:hypothetical protein TEA_014158 [Camellia sinensis var. sinensis]
MASLINRSLTSICNSKSAMCIKTEFSTPFHIGFTSLSLINSRKVSSLIACKAMFAKPQTDIKGLNIANDCLSDKANYANNDDKIYGLEIYSLLESKELSSDVQNLDKRALWVSLLFCYNGEISVTIFNFCFLALLSVSVVKAEDAYKYFTWTVTYEITSPLGVAQQRKNSWQDGVLGTNCPIPPNSNFTYKYQTKDQIGTFTFWHKFMYY